MSEELLSTINELLETDGLPASDRVGLLKQKVELMTTGRPPVQPSGVTPPVLDEIREAYDLQQTIEKLKTKQRKMASNAMKRSVGRSIS